MDSSDNEHSGDLRKNILLLFDVDGTLSKSRQPMQQEMFDYVQSLRKKVHLGLVGGSDLSKIAEQTTLTNLQATPNRDPASVCITLYDYIFAENGLVAYKDGVLLAKQSILNYLGEDRSQTFINFCLAYMSTLRLPAKRGNFIEYRNGLINVCPVGRSCTQSEREAFCDYDKQHHIRKKFIEELESRFGPNSEEPFGLKFAIGGQISFDVYPEGWDKRFCLGLIDLQSYSEVHFFGDKTHPGGNDYEIFEDSRTIGHTVDSPEDTLKQLMSMDL